MPMAFQDASGEGGSTVETVGKGIKTAFPARAAAVTPSDVTVFTIPRAIFVGSTGTVIVTPAGAETPGPVTFTMPTGSVVPVMVIQVLTGGTATQLVSVW